MNKKIALVIDSCADLPKEKINYDYIRVIPLNITFDDGTTIQDGIDMTTEDFYRKMMSSKTLPVTSQPSPNQFLEVYSKLLLEYDEVLSIHLASVLSGTFNSATLAKQMLDKDESERVTLFDTKAVSLVEGFMILEAIKEVNKGNTIGEIVELMKKLRDSLTCLILPDNLNNLKKGGRISHLSALFGGLLQIKPILTVGNKADGKVDIYTKVRGKKKAISKIINVIKETAINIEQQTIGFVHSYVDNEDELNEIINLIKDSLKPKEVIISLVGSTVGTHLGLNGFGILFNEK